MAERELLVVLVAERELFVVLMAERELLILLMAECDVMEGGELLTMSMKVRCWKEVSYYVDEGEVVEGGELLTMSMKVKFTGVRLEKHEGFTMGTQSSRNDIAIGTLQIPLDLSNPLISAVTLATGPEDFADKSCTFTGWGSTNSTMTYPTALRQADLTILSNDVCRTNYTSLDIQDGHLCTQNEDKTICFGDLGGPIVCDGVLAGLSSFGILFNDKCSSAYPSVFTRISFYQDWVTNQPF
ncbi:chymotrypsin-1-like [Gigantopelta aegis]|uniref:chymotrypsin-1-like n=1 Tax=Gigantopelta aegis TaxID=1735272 RepID=UPI001B889C05|nr:chymotrypsin-1-like [Gigantopelta aegis]